MSNYTKSTDFARKDTLPTGNASKIIKGTEINDELNAISTAIASKAEEAGSASQTFAANNLTVAGDATVTGDVTCATINSQVLSGNVIAWATWGTDGTLNAGEGCTVDWPSTGLYNITLDTAQADTYSYAASASTQQDPYSGEIDTYTANTFRVRTYNGTSLNSQPARLIVVG